MVALPICRRLKSEKPRFLPRLLSGFLHAAVLGLIVAIGISHATTPAPQVMQVSIISMAAPESRMQNQTEIAVEKTVEPVEQPKKQEMAYAKPVVKPVQQVIAVKEKSPAAVEEKVKEEKPVEAPRQTSRQAEKTKTAQASGDVGENQSTVIPVITNAEYRNQTPPDYPKRARDMGQQGKVILHALVDAAGTTREVKIVQSSGFSLLDKAASAAVAKWEFEPAKQQGRTVLSWVQVPVQFVIQ